VRAQNDSIKNDTAVTSAAGRVQKVDRAEDTMEIEGVDRQLKLDSSTRVTRNGAPGSFSDIQEGEQVRASFDDGLPARVRQVEIMSPSSMPSGTGTATGTGAAGSPGDMSGSTNTAPDSATTETPSGTLLPRRDSPSTTRDSTQGR
jgi:hypothetical protein